MEYRVFIFISNLHTCVSCWARTFSLSLVTGRGGGPGVGAGPDQKTPGLLGHQGAVLRRHDFPPLGKNRSAGGWCCQVDGDSHAPLCAPRGALVCTPKPCLGGGVINFPYTPFFVEKQSL